jgi:hypothetical protein
MSLSREDADSHDFNASAGSYFPRAIGRHGVDFNAVTSRD